MQFKNVLPINLHVYGSRIVAPYEVFEVDGAHAKDALFLYLVEHQQVIPFHNYPGATTVTPIPPIEPEPPQTKTAVVVEQEEEPKINLTPFVNQILNAAEQAAEEAAEQAIINAIEHKSVDDDNTETQDEAPVESSSDVNILTETEGETLKPKSSQPKKRVERRKPSASSQSPKSE